MQIVVEPSDNAGALLTAIQGAKKSVHMTMYLLGDSRFIDALVAQKQAGLDVKVVLNQTFPNGGSNSASYASLQQAGVGVVWAPAAFSLTHEKCVLIDGASAWIMTMNLERTSSHNREYLGIDNVPADVAEAEAIFQGDFSNTPPSVSGSLLVAPVNARERLLVLLQSAAKNIDLEGEELSDYMIVGALGAAQDKGIQVHVVLANNTGNASQQTAVAQLKQHHVSVVSVASPYIHAKAIVVDGARAYIGSENFTTGSLEYNRELGLLTDTASEVGKVQQAITSDFQAGSPL